MATRVDLLKVRVSFLPGAGERADEEWTFTVEEDGVEIDEQKLDAAFQQLVEQAGQQTTFELERRFKTGGWGATGLTVMEVLVTLGLGAASNAMYAAVAALIRKIVGRRPQAERKQLPRQQARTSPRRKQRKKVGRRKRKK